jgi:hypothetical protein
MGFYSELDITIQERDRLILEAVKELVARNKNNPRPKRKMRTKGEIEADLINAYHEDWFDQYADSIEIVAREII